MARVPLVSGSRIVVVDEGDGVEALRPPAPVEPLADVGAATRDALRFPVSGAPLVERVPRGGRVTIALDGGILPLPPPARDPRADALAALLDELEQIGVRGDRLTLLVSTGLARRPSRKELEQRLGPQVARRFGGRLVVHDATSPDLVEVAEGPHGPIRVSPALVEADAVVGVSSAETVLHGGCGLLLDAADAATLRAARGDGSLLVPDGPGADAVAALARALDARVPLLGVSLALSHPAWGSQLRGFPYDPAATEAVASSGLWRTLSVVVPGPLRRAAVWSLRPQVGATAALAGPLAAAHEQALAIAVAQRGVDVEGQLDALVVGTPSLAVHLGLERPNPLAATHVVLGLALRLWTGTPPVADGGAAIVLHRLHRRFTHPTQTPYRDFLLALRDGREPDELGPAEATAAASRTALDAYRDGRSCHPLLPYAEWADCQPARRRLGAVLVAGCRDATAARQLGLVPARGIGAALAMAHGHAGGRARIGVALTPPFFPLRSLRG